MCPRREKICLRLNVILQKTIHIHNSPSGKVYRVPTILATHITLGISHSQHTTNRTADPAKMMTNIYIHLNVIVKNVLNDLLLDIQSK